MKSNKTLLPSIKIEKNDDGYLANELKQLYRNASIITKKRVVFNIKGNYYRLVVDIEYKLGIIFIVWIGTHKEYDKLDIKEINYVKGN